ncbi:MAG: hypothetical protein MJZ76_04195 [Bacteroidales bacterium]|nr:hypothetical protein [Bacteroidales bacterium]
MNVSSQKHTVNASKEKIFDSISNCKNFEKFLPEQMQGVEVTEESCKFTIPNIATLTLAIVNKVEFSEVLYQATNDKQIPLNIAFHIDDEQGQNTIGVEINVELPVFLAPMVKKPLQNAVDMIAEKLPRAIENL